MIATHPTTELVKTITACRACGSGALDEVLDLGTHAVSDFYATVPADELRAPLCLVQCGGCGLVQLTHSVSKDRLYHDYWYRSGLNPAMVAALKDVVDDAMSRVKLEKGDLVLDIGANDGTLLDQYPEWVRTIGVEPSNLRPTQGRHIIYHSYYPAEYPIKSVFEHKIITSIAMFYDLDDPGRFVDCLKNDLDRSGVWVNQMMDLHSMVTENAFDNICHEHVAYWQHSRFAHFLMDRGLTVTGFSRNNVNGGSLRTIAGYGKPYMGIPNQAAFKVYGPDNSETRPSSIRAFASRIRLLKEQCLAFLEDCRYNGKTVIGYGASTKGNTLLQYYGITSDLLPAIAERNPDKVGKVTAGSHIPIISEAEMRERRPDYLLCLPWHFIDGFLEREKDLLAQGTRLVAPLPTFRVI